MLCHPWTYFAACFFLVVQPVVAAEFIPLGNLSPDYPYSSPSAISSDGTVVVGRARVTSDGVDDAFRWTESTGMVGLGVSDYMLGGTSGSAAAVSGDGSLVVGRGPGPSSSGDGGHVFVWNEEAGLSYIDRPSNVINWWPTNSSLDGSVIVGALFTGVGEIQAYRWTTDVGTVPLGFLPGTDESFVGDVSGDGTIVVGSSASDVDDVRGFRWSEATGMIDLGHVDLTGEETRNAPIAISSDGTTIVGSDSPPLYGGPYQHDGETYGGQAYRWTESTGMVGLGDLPGGEFNSAASDVSADGSVVVGRATSELGQVAIIWDEITGMRSLESILTAANVDLSGWALTDAVAVSDDGLVVTGIGRNSDGYEEAWLVRLDSNVVPEPATSTLALVVCAGLCMLHLRRHTAYAKCLLAPIVFALPMGLAHAAMFIPLGDLPGGERSSIAYAVSNNAVVVGASSSAQGAQEAFRWEAGTMTGMGSLPNGWPGSIANGISGDASVIAGVGYALLDQTPTARAVRWESGSMMALGSLPGGEGLSGAAGVSTDGTTIVGFSDSASGPQAFRWQDGVMSGLGDLPGGDFESYGLAASADGSVIVGQSRSANGIEAFRWESGVMEGLGDLEGGRFESTALDVSEDGSVVVGSGRYLAENGVFSFEQAFRWEDGVMQGLPFPEGFDRSEAHSVTADGSIVVGSMRLGNEAGDAFIWDEVHGTRSLSDVFTNELQLNLMGWELSDYGYPVLITPDGATIAGTGINPDGYQEAWLVRLDSSPIPEPATTALAVACCVMLLVIKSTPRGLLRIHLPLIILFTTSMDSIAAAEFIPLGHLSPGYPNSFPGDISGDGSVVAGEALVANGNVHDAFRWTESTGLVELGVSDYQDNGVTATASGISRDGSVIVGGSSEGGFRWTEWAGIEHFDSPVAALGVNADGTVVIGDTAGDTPTNLQAFRWTTDTGVVPLGYLPGGNWSRAGGVAGDGSVVVGFSASPLMLMPDRWEAFRWTEATGMVGLGHLPGGGESSRASAISDDGTTIVGYSDSPSGRQAMLWTESTAMIGLGDLPGGAFNSWARDVSADGSIIVGGASTSDGRTAFIWDEFSGMRSLESVLAAANVDFSGWRLTNALAVSDDGRAVAGLGTNPDGHQEAWLVRLDSNAVSEPATNTLLLVISAGICICCVRRHIGFARLLHTRAVSKDWAGFQRTQNCPSILRMCTT
ncbi:hypothetical protein NG895_07030 [Aeoliella sp. ICT_H6.2]|uniref:Extracellular repeat, HAF family n=1 Tax=Aeoliella straminimaris TaxID=2954799 RepID=A0A9X2FD58_9BACT|nr:hypothetical protein [Aeoliella straminimaris]MCO6043656.1 hypothetical protein [Aeoliella straminimaris]